MISENTLSADLKRATKIIKIGMENNDTNDNFCDNAIFFLFRVFFYYIFYKWKDIKKSF